ncbi:MAG: glycosyltransferase [Cyclobacteriaceae bacterium]
MQERIKVLMLPDYRADNPFQHLLEQALSKQNVEVVFAKGYKRVLPIYRQLKSHKKTDVLHLHWITPYLRGENSFVVFFYALKFLFDLTLTKFKTPIVWTIHNQVSHDSRFPKIERFTYRITSKLVDEAILHGNSLKGIIQKDYKISDRKLSIINLGNYKSIYPPLIEKKLAREKLSIPTEVRKVFLHQGLLKPYKGIDELIQVWNDNSKEVNDCMLVIAGKSPDKNYEDNLRKLIDSNKTVQLICRYVTDDELSVLYSASDVVVLPFRRIMASSSLMVAISLGRPVIAPKLGASEELLGDASDLLYDTMEGNEGLKIAIIKSTRIDLAELTKRTEARAIFFDWDQIGKSTADLYRKAIRG